MMGHDFYGVRMAAAISLGEIGTDSARAALAEGYRTSRDPRVRRSCVFAMGNFKSEGVKEEVADFLRDALAKDESYFAGVAAVRGLAYLGSEKAYDILRASLSYTSWQEVITAAIFHGFSHAKEKRAVDLAIEQSGYGKPTPLRVAAIGCLGALGKELNKDKADDKVVDHLIELLNDKSIRARVSAIRALPCMLALKKAYTDPIWAPNCPF